MRFVMFYHSLVSDWNHGNAHFLRGVATELMTRGHEVMVYEPRDGWSASQLVADHGQGPIEDFQRRYPRLLGHRYDPADVDLAALLDGADVVLVHEWNDPALVQAIGSHRAAGGWRLLFHDTHHRAVSDPEAMARYDLSNYDGVLAFGEVLRQVYLSRGWCQRAFTWHEAADVRIFRPQRAIEREGDLVWIGNWGDGERSAELDEFLIEPARSLGLRGTVHGVRYPLEAVTALGRAGLRYRGWLPNFRVPEVFARHRVTVHVPRRPYARDLAGIPTIRMFEALACGIPLVSAPWEDREGLFEPGRDYLVARDGSEMREALAWVRDRPEEAAQMAERGRARILSRHTCAHRVNELMTLLLELGGVGPDRVTPGAQPTEVMA